MDCYSRWWLLWRYRCYTIMIIIICVYCCHFHECTPCNILNKFQIEWTNEQTKSGNNAKINPRMVFCSLFWSLKSHLALTRDFKKYHYYHHHPGKMASHKCFVTWSNWIIYVPYRQLPSARPHFCVQSTPLPLAHILLFIIQWSIIMWIWLMWFLIQTDKFDFHRFAFHL